jgi:cell division septation protein DedD
MRITFFALIIVSIMLLVSATVWEGVAEPDSSGELPGNYSVATNSFPRNTVVDITNLENGKMVRVKVVSGLETGGLLAMLSRTAAESVDLRGNFSVRIRMTQPSDDIAFSLFNLGPLTPAGRPAESFAETYADGTGAGMNAPQGFAQSGSGANAAQELAGAEQKLSVSPEFAENNLLAADNSALPYNQPYNSPYDSPYNQSYDSPYNSPYNSAENLLSPIVAPILETPAETAGYYGEPGIVYGKLTLVPSEERIPTPTGYVIAPDDIIPSIGAAITAQPELEYLPPITAAAVRPETEYSSPVEFSPFQAPLISRLEPNKWYVQVGTYGRAEYVEDEISRIGATYPLAVQNVGTDTNPLFRIMLGPLNQGESGAMLQRFKSLGYTDAFIRYN